jgi:lipoate-protein ligase A
LLSFEEALEAERALLARLSEQGATSAGFIVWRTHQALIVPRGMSARPCFPEAARAAGALGWDVKERDTGGDLTPQAPGMINLSMAFRDDTAPPSIGRAYHRLLAPLLSFLKDEMGLEAYASAIEGSFCDGDYNVAVAGRKLGGSAQRWKMSRTPAGGRAADIMAHVALICDMPLDRAIGAINEFYRLCKIDRRIDVERHVSLADMVGADRARPARVAAEIASFLAARRI